ncbi:hypothetical protein CPB83DRAFT_906952 [Crepidotus variabilis]|uniref:F-box domain-containing protein n=1 Tax=Crepidotus variabilis TaxID=179855 RepID=A0A9P6JPJ0_9AGAR|nr:hypothetical protein CPB83DRAFT_906952 [Crepidotus variabilis]
MVTLEMKQKLRTRHEGGKNEKTRNYHATNYREALNEKNRWLSLPTELTIAIFLLCDAVNSTWHEWSLGPGVDDISHFSLPIEFILSSICRRWRYLSLDLPALWKRFVYIRLPSGFNFGDFPPEKLSIYEERSGGQLEDIYLDIFNADYKNEFAKFIDDIFLRHSQTLRRFSLISKGAFEISFHLLDLFPDASVPNLEYFAAFAFLKNGFIPPEMGGVKPELFMNGAPSTYVAMASSPGMVFRPQQTFPHCR